MNKIIIYLVCIAIVISTLCCVSPKKVDEKKGYSYLFWIRKIPKNEKFIDYEDEYWLLTQLISKNTRNIRIGNEYFTPYYIPFDLVQNVSICCKDPLFKDNLNLEQEEYEIFYSEDINFNKPFTLKYLNYKIRVYSINANNLCKCSKNYSGLTSEIIKNYAYPTNNLDFFPLSKKQRSVIHGDIASVLNHPEIFGSN